MPFLLDDRNSGYSHSRGSSEVQGKVAQFNGLAKEAAQRRKDNEAALKRAILGREEAEGESRRLRDGNERLRMEVEEGRSRERKVGERLEAVQVYATPVYPQGPLGLALADWVDNCRKSFKERERHKRMNGMCLRRRCGEQGKRPSSRRVRL